MSFHMFERRRYASPYVCKMFRHIMCIPFRPGLGNPHAWLTILLLYYYYTTIILYYYYTTIVISGICRTLRRNPQKFGKHVRCIPLVCRMFVINGRNTDDRSWIFTIHMLTSKAKTMTPHVLRLRLPALSCW